MSVAAEGRVVVCCGDADEANEVSTVASAIRAAERSLGALFVRFDIASGADMTENKI